MAEKIATRAAYGKALVALGDKYPELVVLDADLSGSTMTKDFAAAYPERFFNMGIAECNMAGVAAGLAACGKKPFINSFATVSYTHLVHLAVEVLNALNIDKRCKSAVIILDKAAGDTGNGSLNRHARVHKRQGRAAY